MKTRLIYLIPAVILITACMPETKTVPVDPSAAKAEVSALFNQYNSAFKAKDISTLALMIADDALICGTDASEIMDKKQTLDNWTQSFKSDSMLMNYSVDKQEIRVGADGKSAIVVEQYTFPLFSPKIPLRSIFHAVKAGENWMIDFISWNLIPRNEDLAKLNKALE